MKSMRKHSQFEDFLNNIPETWCYDRMKTVVSLRNLKTKEKSPKKDYLELEDIESGTGKLISKRESLNVDSSVTIFRKGDVLFGKLRPYLEKYYLANFDGKCTGEILAFRPEKIESSFLLYCVASFSFIEQCKALSYGTKMPRVNWKKQLAYFNIPLPPSHEQKLIAAYLNTVCSKIHRVIEIKERQLKTLDSLEKSIIHKAVTRGLDESVGMKDSGVEWIGRIPIHWRCEHLKRLSNRIQTGSTPPTSKTEYYVDGTIPWFAPGCYDEDIYLKTPSKMINVLAYQENKLRIFPSNSIFLVGIGATIGKVAITGVEASCNQQITAIVCRSDISMKYVTYQLKIYEIIIRNISQFTTLPIMDQVKIGYLNMVLPPREEQDKIVSYLEDKLHEISDLKCTLISQIKILEKYRQLLIHECVTGKRRITKEVLAEVQNNV